jgi:polyisoprenoid-binding protein YceI
MTPRLAAVLGGILALVVANVAPAADWRIDAPGSKLEFFATFKGAKAAGVFESFDARIHFDPDHVADNRMDVTIAVATADMIDAEVNQAIRGPEWFDAARYPQAAFHSNDIRALGANRYLAHGSLALKGIELPVDASFVWSNTADAATMTGELSVKRGDFHIGTGEWAPTDIIGANVVVKFSVRLRKDG